MKVNPLGILVLFVLFIYLPAVLVPASWFWYSPGDTVFSDAYEGEAPPLSYYREIKVDTLIQYSVAVRDEAGEIVCDAIGGPFTYKALKSGVLTGKTLADWAPSDPRCRSLPVGSYVAETTWTVIHPLGDYLPEGPIKMLLGGLLPPKYVSKLSPVFRINPRPQEVNIP